MNRRATKTLSAYCVLILSFLRRKTLGMRSHTNGANLHASRTRGWTDNTGNLTRFLRLKTHTQAHMLALATISIICNAKIIRYNRNNFPFAIELGIRSFRHYCNEFVRLVFSTWSDFRPSHGNDAPGRRFLPLSRLLALSPYNKKTSTRLQILTWSVGSWDE